MKKRFLSLMAVGALVLVAQVAATASASAAAAQFRAEEYPVSLTGKALATTKIVTKSGTLTCTGASFEGSAAGAVTAIAVAPAYSGCQLNSIPQVKVNRNSCNQTFTNAAEAAPYAGTAGIECSKAGDAIEVIVTGSNCVIKFGAQSSLSSVAYQNEGSNRGRTIKATVSLSGLAYTATGSECPATGTYSDGTLSATYQLGGVHNGVYLATEQVLDPAQFEAEGSPTWINGNSETNTSIGVTTGTISCSNVTMTGSSVATPSAQLTVQPQLSGCKLFGVSFAFTTTGCQWNLNVASAEFPIAAGSLGISCSAGKVLSAKITGMNCEIQIPGQTLNGLAYENTGSGSTRSIKARPTMTGLAYTEVGSECASPGAHTNGAIANGTWMVRGYVPVGGTFGAQRGIWVQ